MTQLRIQLNLDLQRKEQVDNYLQSLEKKINLLFKEINIENYWKIPTKQISFIIELPEIKKEEIVYQTLKIAHLIKRELWMVNGPYELNGFMFFECILNNKTDAQLLKWAHLEVEIEN